MTEQRHADRRMPRRELAFRMSSELHRRRAIEAMQNVAGGSIFAFPVERRSTGETLLLVVMADEGHQGLAIAAVLSIDPCARQQSKAAWRPLRRTVTASTSSCTKRCQTSSSPSTPRTAGTVAGWGQSRGSRVRAEQDGSGHSRGRTE
jgi:hypothetical protein